MSPLTPLTRPIELCKLPALMWPALITPTAGQPATIWIVTYIAIVNICTGYGSSYIDTATSEHSSHRTLDTRQSPYLLQCGAEGAGQKGRWRESYKRQRPCVYTGNRGRSQLLRRLNQDSRGDVHTNGQLTDRLRHLDSGPQRRAGPHSITEA